MNAGRSGKLDWHTSGRRARLMYKRNVTQTYMRHTLCRPFLSGGLTSFVLLLLLTVYAPVAMGEIGGIVSEPHGDIWFTEPATHIIGKLSPTGMISRFQVPNHGEPDSLSLGPSSEIWFTERKARRIGRIDQHDAFSEYSVPLPPAHQPEARPLGLGPPLKPSELPGPGAITTGPDGDLWFTDGGGDSSITSFYGGQIDRATPNGSITEFAIPSTDSQPNQIVAGPDGNLWFTEDAGNGGMIGRITPSGAVTMFPLPESHEPGAIASGPGGAVWFTDVVFGSKHITGRIGRITPAGSIRYFALSTPEAQPAGLALGADGDLWFTAGTPHLVKSKLKGRRSFPIFVGSIGRITPSGQVTEYPIRNLSLEIAPGPQEHEMLFVPEASNEIGRISLTGKVSEYPIRGGHSVLARATAAVLRTG